MQVKEDHKLSTLALRFNPCVMSQKIRFNWLHGSFIYCITSCQIKINHKVLFSVGNNEVKYSAYSCVHEEVNVCFFYLSYRDFRFL